MFAAFRPVFDPSRRTHILVHGWLGSRNSPWMATIKDELLQMVLTLYMYMTVRSYILVSFNDKFHSDKVAHSCTLNSQKQTPARCIE